MEDNNKKFISTIKDIKPSTRKTLFSILLSLALLGSFFLGFFIHANTINKDNQTILELLKIIEQNSNNKDENYTTDEIADLIVSNVLKNDKYAKYYSKEEYQKLLMEDSGTYDNIGIYISYDSLLNEHKIVNIVWNSPAERDGLKIGDVILAGKTGVYEKNTREEETNTELLSESLSGENSEPSEADRFLYFNDENSISAFMQQTKDYPVIILKVKRLKNDGITYEEKDISIIKIVYNVSYVLYRDSDCEYIPNSEKPDRNDSINLTKGDEWLKDDTCYIKLTQFEGEADKQFIEALRFMKEKGRTKLILDLCDNGGGNMNILTNITSALINNDGKRARICYIEKSDRTNELLTSENLYYKYNLNIEKIAILANKNTASASEVLIGALMYYDKTAPCYSAGLFTFYNDNRDNYTTFGKGIMQTTYSLTNGGAIKLTTAKLYQPDKVTCIQDVGICSTVEENWLASKDEAYVKQRLGNYINPAVSASATQS